MHIHVCDNENMCAYQFFITALEHNINICISKEA